MYFHCWTLSSSVEPSIFQTASSIFTPFRYSQHWLPFAHRQLTHSQVHFSAPVSKVLAPQLDTFLIANHFGKQKCCGLRSSSFTCFWLVLVLIWILKKIHGPDWKMKKISPFCIQFNFSQALVTVAAAVGVSLEWAPGTPLCWSFLSTQWLGLEHELIWSPGLTAGSPSGCCLQRSTSEGSLKTPSSFGKLNQTYSAANLTEYTGLNYWEQIAQSCCTLHHLSTPSFPSSRTLFFGGR